MLLVDLLPSDFCEVESCMGIFRRLNRYLLNDYTLVCRSWENAPTKRESKYIVIVTSCEQHNYIPPEKDDPNCLGVFMHYYPTVNAYNPKLTYENKIFPLHLGTKAGFNPHKKTIAERKYNVGFIGQFDPYRRVVFKEFAMACSARYLDSFICFYDGWNKGVQAYDYAALMSEFKIALVPCGSASLNTFRYYEALASGCIIFGEEQYTHPSIKLPPENTVGKITTDWIDHDRVFQLIDSCLKSSSIEIARINILRNYQNFYSPEACAEYIMNHIKETNYV